MNNTIKIAILVSTACLLNLVMPASGGQSNATLSGPVLGYVFNVPEGKLRPLRGVAGNATIGDPEPFDFSISQSLMLDARHAVVSTDANPELLAINMESHPASIAAIRNAPSGPTRAIGSVHGNAAAFYYAGSQRMVIVTGLPGNPVVSQSADLSALNPPTLMCGHTLAPAALCFQYRTSVTLRLPETAPRSLPIASRTRSSS
jgi:hypothetical protein